MELIAHRYRTARKNHVCDLCGARIDKGEKYSYSFVRDSGDHWSCNEHLECEFVANELWEWINPWDGLTDDEFEDGCNQFCRRMICPRCEHWNTKFKECEEDSSYCMDKIVTMLKEYDFCLIKPPADIPEAAGKRCWGLVKKKQPVTKLPRHES